MNRRGIQSAIVTGTSTGIGFETALRLAREGLRVHATVRTEASGASLVEAAGDLSISLVAMDVDDDASVAAGIAGVLEAEGGEVDVLVNNAGISRGGAAEDTGLDVYEAVMNTNAWGTVRCTKAVLASMRERGGGCIVNVTSVAGFHVQPTMSAYAMAKHAQQAFTAALAEEVNGFGIRVAAIQPGVILTPIFEKAMASPTKPSEPYKGHIDRLNRVFLSRLADPTPPDAVADVIWQAITTDEPRLSWRVGDDADTLWKARMRILPEEWIARISDPDDAAWAAFASEITGTTIT